MSLRDQALTNINATDRERAWMPLVDRHIDSPRQEEPRESMGDVCDDVQAALDQVAVKETKERIASDIGLRGVTAIRSWQDHAIAVGPHQAVGDFAQAAARQPKPVQSRDEPRREQSFKSDWHHLDHSVRDAMKQAAEKQRVRDEMPAARRELDELERRGSLGEIQKYRAWHDQLAADPVDAAPRVANELAAEFQEGAILPAAQEAVSEFWRSHETAPDVIAVMVRTLASGGLPSTGNNAMDLQNAHAYAQWATAADVDDSYTKDVVAAQRVAGGGVSLWLGLGQVAEWQRAHPNVKRDSPVWNRMRDLLDDSRSGVKNLDQAYEMARRG
jgi:hypothetical protein